jgi:hypothetical protein
VCVTVLNRIVKKQDMMMPIQIFGSECRAGLESCGQRTEHFGSLKGSRKIIDKLIDYLVQKFSSKESVLVYTPNTLFNQNPLVVCRIKHAVSRNLHIYVTKA